jgi:LuxR family maltose regulon positive regulatory protein
VRALVSSDNERQAGFTKAELRLLPLLATHLSFREIGARLYVSRNTIKTQALSVYRKLGVSSRSEAIERATEIGLLAGRVAPQLSPCIVSASLPVNAPSS